MDSLPHGDLNTENPSKISYECTKSTPNLLDQMPNSFNTIQTTRSDQQKTTEA